MIISLPEGYKGKYGSFPSPCIFSLQSTTLSDYGTDIYIQLCVNNVQVTANTCTCADVFTVITTTKDQSGGLL